MKNRIYGHSDDCICIDGQFNDEYYIDEGGTGLLLRGPNGEEALVRCRWCESPEHNGQDVAWDFDMVEVRGGVTPCDKEINHERSDEYGVEFQIRTDMEIKHAEAWPWYEGAALSNFPRGSDVREKLRDRADELMEDVTEDQAKKIWKVLHE